MAIELARQGFILEKDGGGDGDGFSENLVPGIPLERAARRADTDGMGRHHSAAAISGCFLQAQQFTAAGH